MLGLLLSPRSPALDSDPFDGSRDLSADLGSTADFASSVPVEGRNDVPRSSFGRNLVHARTKVSVRTPTTAAFVQGTMLGCFPLQPKFEMTIALPYGSAEGRWMAATRSRA